MSATQRYAAQPNRAHLEHLASCKATHAVPPGPSRLPRHPGARNLRDERLNLGHAVATRWPRSDECLLSHLKRRDRLSRSFRYRWPPPARFPLLGRVPGDDRPRLSHRNRLAIPSEPDAIKALERNPLLWNPGRPSVGRLEDEHPVAYDESMVCVRKGHAQKRDVELVCARLSSPRLAGIRCPKNETVLADGGGCVRIDELYSA